jgi:hypothetical protein
MHKQQKVEQEKENIGRNVIEGNETKTRIITLEVKKNGKTNHAKVSYKEIGKKEISACAIAPRRNIKKKIFNVMNLILIFLHYF